MSVKLTWDTRAGQKGLTVALYGATVETWGAMAH